MKELLVIAACVAVALGLVWAVTSSPTVWGWIDAHEANRLRTAADAKANEAAMDAYWEAHPEFSGPVDLYKCVRGNEPSEDLTAN